MIIFNRNQCSSKVSEWMLPMGVEFQTSSDNFARAQRCHYREIPPKITNVLASHVEKDDPKKRPNWGPLGFGAVFSAIVTRH